MWMTELAMKMNTAARRIGDQSLRRKSMASFGLSAPDPQLRPDRGHRASAPPPHSPLRPVWRSCSTRPILRRGGLQPASAETRRDKIMMESSMWASPVGLGVFFFGLGVLLLGLGVLQWGSRDTPSGD